MIYGLKYKYNMMVTSLQSSVVCSWDKFNNFTKGLEFYPRSLMDVSCLALCIFLEDSLSSIVLSDRKAHGLQDGVTQTKPKILKVYSRRPRKLSGEWQNRN